MSANDIALGCMPPAVFADAAECADVITLVLATDSQHHLPEPAAKHYALFRGKPTQPKLGFGLAVQLHVPDIEALLPNIAAVGRHEALLVVPGRFPGHPVYSASTINAYKDAPFLRAFGLKLGPERWLAANPGPSHIARVKRLMLPSSWVVLDNDPDTHTPERWRSEPVQWLSDLSQVLPGLAGAPALMVPSNSARIADSDGAIRSPGRCTIWVQTSGASSSDLRDQARVQVKQLLIAGGHGWSNERGVSVPIDLATWTVGQPSYAGKPRVARGSGLRVLDVKPVVMNADARPWNLATLPSVAAADYLGAERRLRPGVKVSTTERRSRLRLDVCDLGLDEQVELEDGGVASLVDVREMLRAGAKKVRLQTPFRPESRSCAAYAALSKSGDLLIVDSADSSTTHWLKREEVAAEDFSGPSGDLASQQTVDPSRATETPNSSRGDDPASRLANVVSFSDSATDVVAPDYVVHLVFQRGCLYSFTAPPGHAKTAVALTLAQHVAAGVVFHGHPVTEARVLFLSGENPHDVRLRAVAAAKAFDLDVKKLGAQLFFTRRPFAIDDRQQLRTFIDDARRYGPFGLVVIDTGPAHSSADDENDNRAMHDLAENMRRLLEPLGNPAILALMHPSKSATRDTMTPRGGGAFAGSIDGEVCVWKTGDSVEMFHRTKFRGPGFRPMHFEIQEIQLDGLVDNFGAPVKTIVAMPAVVAKATRSKPLSGAERIALEALREARSEHAVPPSPEIISALGPESPAAVVVESDWRARCLMLGISDGNEQAKTKAFRRARSRLLDSSAVHTRSGWYWEPSWIGTQGL